MKFENIERIVVEVPSWLGDSVMATPTLQNLERIFPESEIILVGSKVAIDVLEGFKNVKESYVISRKGNRTINLYKISKNIGKVDISISMRTSLFSGLFQFMTKAPIRVAKSTSPNSMFLSHRVKAKRDLHQVEQYLTLLEFLEEEIKPYDLKLNFQPHKFQKSTLGINAGATYGSAKRWYPEKFAEVGQKLSDRFDIVLFGGAGEVEINRDIESYLVERGVKNLKNLAGKTSIRELAEYIGGLSLFITNDSGPMHIAGAYKIPTIAIFGSTNHLQTDQWHNPNQVIVRKEIECSPCMKRECPLKHHECMKMVEVDDVLRGVGTLETPITLSKK